MTAHREHVDSGLTREYAVLSESLDRIDMIQSTRRFPLLELSDLLHRRDSTDLIVDIHHGYQDDIFIQLFLEHAQVDSSTLVNGYPDDLEPFLFQHLKRFRDGGMFHLRRYDFISRTSVGPGSADESPVICLRPSGCEINLVRSNLQYFSDRLRGSLHIFFCLDPLGMHGGWIAVVLPHHTEYCLRGRR